MECQYRRGLEPKLLFEFLGDLANEALEGKLEDEEFGALLVLAYFPECHGPGAVAMWLFDAARRGCELPSFHAEVPVGSLPV